MCIRDRYLSGIFYFIFRFSGYFLVVSSHYKNEFDARGQLFTRFLNFAQFAVCLSFFVLSIKSLFVENWDYFLLNSGLLILSTLLAIRGLTSFKLKDYTEMRSRFFQSEGLNEDHLDFENQDQIFKSQTSQNNFPDSETSNVKLQRSVINKFHNLYTDSVIKEVILRSQIQFKLQNSSNEQTKDLRISQKSRRFSDFTDRLPSKNQDSLACIISDKNVNKLSKHYMNTCGLDISYGSVEKFEEPQIRTKKIIKDLVEYQID